MTKAGKNITQTALPLLLYLAVSLCAAVIGEYMAERFGAVWAKDAALLASLSALCSLPLLLGLWRADRKTHPLSVEHRRKGLLFYAAAFLGGAAVSWISAWIMQGFRMDELFSNRAQEALFASRPSVQILGLGVLVPLTEELLYRGLTYERLREFLPDVPAVLAASLLFALSHGNVIQIIYAFPAALLMQWLYRRSGSLAGPVLFHMGANLLSVFVELISK